MDENSSKSKGAGISIAVILLAIVIGFGFVIGLTQTSGANNLNNKQSEISNYVFDENGTLMSYTGDMTELEIPCIFLCASGSPLPPFELYVTVYMFNHTAYNVASLSI